MSGSEESRQETRQVMGVRLAPAELRPVIIVAVAVVLISCLPYVVGYLATPPDRVFGGFVLDEVDSNAYLAKMQQGAQGHWKATLLHTPEEHPALVLYVFYLALGHVAAWLNLPLILVYHAARVVCGLTLLVGLYLFLGLMFDSRRTRWVAYLLAAIGSGIGWLIILMAKSSTLGGVSPLDFWLMEAYVFFTLFLFPQSALAMALLLGLLGGMIRFFSQEKGWRPWFFALGCGLALALLNPYTLVVAAVILSGYWLALWIARRRLPGREALALTALAAPLAPPMAYYALQFNSHSVWRSFLAQDILPSPPIWYYLAGYGLIFLLALPGARRALTGQNERQLLLVAWPVAVFLASYLPYSGQRRLIFGGIIPLSGLAALGLLAIVIPWIQQSRLGGWLAGQGYSRERLGKTAILFSVALVSISNLLLLTSSGLSAAGGHSAIAQPLAVEEAIAWLGENTGPEDVILSSYRIGNIIPARIGRRVVWGHWDETAFFDEKQAPVTAFFKRATSDAERRELLARYGVDYVFYGPAEREMGSFDPTQVDYLTLVSAHQDVNLYEVKLP